MTSTTGGTSREGIIRIATRRSVVTRAFRVAIVVGTVLGLLNHGDAILAGTVNAGRMP